MLCVRGDIDQAPVSLQRIFAHKHCGEKLAGNNFNMLPKSGDLIIVSNWRPIAKMHMCCKIFFRVVYLRVQSTLGRHESVDQFGLRLGRGVDDVFCIVENVAS